MAIAQELTERGLHLAEIKGDRGSLCQPIGVWAKTWSSAGSLLKRAHISPWQLAISTRPMLKDWLSLGAIAPSVILALDYLELGFADYARQLIVNTLQGAEHRMNAYELAFVRIYACISYTLLRDPLILRSHADGLIGLADEIPFVRGNADFYTGQALLMSGQAEDGKLRMRQGIALLKSNGFDLARTWELEIEAGLQANEGKIQDALVLLAEALDTKEQVLWRRSPALILRAALLVRSGAGTAEIEAEYRAAIYCAHSQGAKFHELEAATHFAGWLKLQGRREEARTSLAAIYNWFTEGFDTLALKKAKVLLDQLN